MQGLELAARYYHEAVAPIVARRFPTLADRHAAGLNGYGSDVLGHDDELSRDHEWGPRCFLWLREPDYHRYARRLDETLSRELPATFLGFSTRFRVDRQIEALVPVEPGEEGMHHVVITSVARHLRFQIGSRRPPQDPVAWLCIPEQRLLEFTRGRIFRDPLGEITAARAALAYLPDGVWRMKMLYAWSALGCQLDNIGLCATRGDALSAHRALHKTVDAAIQLLFLLNRRYRPGTVKWLSRELYALPRLAAELGPQLEAALTTQDLQKSADIMDGVARRLAEEHVHLGITPGIVAAGRVRACRGQVRFSPAPLLAALQESLPPALRELEIGGGLDQWVAHEDVLIWAKHFRKYEGVYRKRSHERRDGVGDMMI